MTYEIFIKENISSVSSERVEDLSSRVIRVHDCEPDVGLDKSKAELYLREFFDRAEKGLKEKFPDKKTERFVLIDNVLEQRVAFKITNALDGRDMVVTFSSVVYQKDGTSTAVIIKYRHDEQLIFFGKIPLTIKDDQFISACMVSMENALSKSDFDLYKSPAFFALRIAHAEKHGMLSPYYRSNTVASIIEL